jgi:hypothetical protein
VPYCCRRTAFESGACLRAFSYPSIANRRRYSAAHCSATSAEGNTVTATGGKGTGEEEEGWVRAAVRAVVEVAAAGESRGGEKRCVGEK